MRSTASQTARCRRLRTARTLTISLAAFVCSATAWSQTSTGGVRGFVKDDTGGTRSNSPAPTARRSISVSGCATPMNQDGRTARLIIVRGLGQGNVTMLAEPRGKLFPAGGERFPGADRQGPPYHRDTAASPVARRIQHLQLRYRAHAAQQQLAGDCDHTVAQTLSIVRPRTVQLGFRYQF